MEAAARHADAQARNTLTHKHFHVCGLSPCVWRPFTMQKAAKRKAKGRIPQRTRPQTAGTHGNKYIINNDCTFY